MISNDPELLRVNQFSESLYFPAPHGVHSVFCDTISALQAMPGLNLGVNQWWRDGVLHIHTVGPASLIKMINHRGPVLVSAHLASHSLLGSLAGARMYTAAWSAYLDRFYSQADAILAVSEEVRSELLSRGIRKPVHVVHNGVDLTVFKSSPSARQASRKALGVGQDERVVLCVAQLQPRKCPHIFVECARKFSDVKFVWVGESLFGPISASRAEIRSLMAGAPRNLHFTGGLPREDVSQWCRAADVFLFPSHHETFGLAILEAAASGLPIITRRLPVYDDIFGEPGIDRLTAEDIPDFIDQVDYLLSSPEARQRFGQRSLSVASSYGSEVIAKDLVKVYEQI
ncbi:MULTISPECIES: glycosyltransferase family 4 protein [Streptomyces]|uniref:glycosyltransferase family 4 protein n=1 Tax=Streptomyces TaxID=1883 RepID=UPI00099CA639|nr:MULTISPECIES: glycosyltransferase family 4 protein [Streptomyces]